MRWRRGAGGIVGLVLLLLGCATPLQTTPVKAGGGGGGPLVLVLKSQSAPLHRAALDVFERSIRADLVEATLEPGTDGGAVRRYLATARPKLILALGTPAALLAREASQSVPILFTLALAQGRARLGAGANVMGISMENAPLQEFTKFKMVMPALNRVLVLYTPGFSDADVEEARAALTEINVDLVRMPVPAGADAVTILAARAGEPFDALWLASDPVMKQFEALKAACNARHLPLLTSLSDVFAKSGALMSVAVDLRALGAQAAGMARLVLEGGMSPQQLGIQHPNGVKLAVNTAVAEALGIDVPLDILGYIDEVIDPRAPPESAD
jgi:ABC-type uncharacterized transport system substrate-binding protein